MRRRLLVWGYGAWLWRAVLFFGIALAVYHLFFKVLGIFLMLVELVWFIGLPVWKELQQWWLRRGQAAPGKTLRVAGGLALLLAVLLLPWRGAVDVPAMLEASRVSALHAPVAARVKSLLVGEGQRVAQGTLLLELESPDLASRQSIVRREIDILQLLLRRQAGRSETAGDVGVLEQQLAEAVAEYRGLAAQRERLQLRAPRSGYCATCRPSLCPASGSTRPRPWGGSSSRACACAVTWPRPTCGGWRSAAKGASSPMTRRGRQCRYGWSR